MNFTVFNYLSLGIIFGLSAVILFEDIKSKKIRNKWIVLGFIAGFLLFLAGFAYGLINFNYLINVSINTGISFLIGFGIWRLNFWPAGDAKLFILFSFLLPLYYYKETYLNYFPSIAFLINVFVIFLFFLILKSSYLLFKSFIDLLKDKKIKKEFLIKYLDEKKYKLISSLRNKKVLRKIFLKIFIGFLIYFILAKFLFKISFQPKTFLFSFSIFFIIGALINFYINKYSKEKIKIEDLGLKMNLATETILKFKKNKDFFKNLGTLRPEGLEDKQVDLIKKHLVERNILEIYIYKTLSFSPWLIIGTALTVILKGNIVSLFINLT